MNIYSPNMLKTYRLCPKKYYFHYIENINVPQSELPFEKGKKIHALANYNLQGIKIDRLEGALNESERSVWEKLKQNPYYNKECFKSEFALSCSVLGISEQGKTNRFWIGGRIDAVVHDSENYFILDYKTGSAPKNAKYDFQTMIYLLCMDKYLKDYNKLAFVYIDLKNDIETVTEFSKELGIEYEKKITETITTIENDSIFETNHENCKFCEYSKICRSCDFLI